MRSYNQVIVVEGKHDEQKIKSVFPEIECIVTNGSSISKETLNLIYETSKEKEVILFLDPDFQGKKITNAILETKGNFKIAYINKEKAISKNKKKVGVEHASTTDILESLDKYFSITESTVKISYDDLLNRGLVYWKESKTRRENLCKSLNIPVSNGKALVKTLNMLNIGLERVDEILE